MTELLTRLIGTQLKLGLYYFLGQGVAVYNYLCQTEKRNIILILDTPTLLQHHTARREDIIMILP